MHSINPLEVPEITWIIARYLSNVEPCLAVCKTWRSLYLPFYWRKVQSGNRTPGRKDHTTIFDPIRHSHYRTFIRVLTVHNDFGLIDQSLDYPNLRLLRLHHLSGDISSRPDGEDPILKDFVNRHPFLKCLELYDIPPSITDSAWTALVGHPRLEKVILECHSPVPDDFWRVCTQLRTLEFSDSSQGCIPKDLILPSIRRLRLARLNKLEFMDQLDIIAACPLLEELVWVAGYHDKHPVWARFGQLATLGTWPHLHQLSTDSDVNDADLSQVIASMHQATKIEIYNDSFGPLSFATLRRHAGTLQRLSIPGATDSKMVRDVLCSFTRLEHLKASCIEAKDIAEGGPWACTSLRSLSVKISFSSEEDNLQPVVFERMSRLVHLEEFSCWFYRHPGATSEHGLIFRLQSGMAALDSLRRLRSVRLDSSIQAMDLDDARWIMDHWKRLKTIRGRLSQDKSMAEQLGLQISTSGIELELSF